MSDLIHFYILVKVTSNFHKLPNMEFRFSFVDICPLGFSVMESEFVRYERRLIDLSGEIGILNGRMMLYMGEIKVVAKYHRSCTI